MMKKKIVIKTTGSYKKIPVEEITYCKADGSYTRICFGKDESIVVTKLLKELETELQAPEFFRISRSHLVNLDKSNEIIKNGHCELKMDNGERLKVSRSRVKELVEKFC
ncbi:MAG TPA: LytTR family DNA-binding domain-containing protein [Bacteroidales bacterium]|nr:LytTR family DNA-binding domain-containing protein [Bacteroidales bacterium]